MTPTLKNPLTRLRWGLLSTARINRALIPVLRQSRRSECAAVASRSAQSAQAYAQEWGIPRAFDSYEAMLADPDIDVIYNSLPNSLHAEWTIRAVQAGKHVLCEKPLATSVEQVDAIIQAASRAGRIVAEAFMYRHHPQTLRVKEIVQSGMLGELRLVRGAFSFTLDRPGNPRLDPAMGGGSIWDVGCYPISYARYVIGAEPVEVFGWQMSAPSGIDETFVGQMHFPNGVVAQFDSSFHLPYRAQMEFIGTHAGLRVRVPYKPGKAEKIDLLRGDQTETITIRGTSLYQGEVEDMENAILHGQPPRISLADSRANIAVIQALLRSAQEGTPCEPNLPQAAIKE